MAGGKVRKAGLFSGLRLLLAGFEEASQIQYDHISEEVARSGGGISQQYDSSCTHVIVFNLPLNDPICCAARKDGKALVTDTWITDCLETDALADVNNVLYRPLKDLGGIDGSNKLCICLTGYQGIARKNIMRMVELMGAKFSKPLIGSVVTHLVCYKFEGEKYELAKKSGMELVNHFWLEDSLKSWTVLPESAYARSGWEAENLKSSETIVEDSGEEDTVAPKVTDFEKKSPGAKVPPTAAAVQILNQNNENSVVDDDLNKGSKSPHEKSKSRDSLPSPASNGKVRKVGSAVDRITDVSGDIRRPEQTSPVSKPSPENFPVDAAVAATDNRNGSSVADVEGDESTRLYVEDGNESDHSCGRTSDAETKNKSDDSLAVEMEVVEPVDAIDTTCHKMELMGFATDHTTGEKAASGADDDKSGDVDENLESPGTNRRRRSSQFAEKEEEPPLEKSTGHGDDEVAKDFADLDMEESAWVASVLNPQPLAVPGSNIKQDNILASPAGVCPSADADELPQEMEVCEPNSGFSIEESAMEISSNETDPAAMCDVQSAQGPPPGSPAHVHHQDGADNDTRSPNQKRQESVKTTTPARAAVGKGKKKALKTNASGNNARPGTLKKIAQSYNPPRKEKVNQKKTAVIEDKENYVAKEDDDQTIQHTPVKKNTATKKPVESRKTSALEPSKMCFAVGGSTDERTNLHSIIKIMGGKVSQSRYQWRDGATHVVLPGPLRRTEKFLAGAAAGRWILKPEYLEASRKAGRFLEEEAYEWYGEGTNDKGTISLQAPRKWRTSVATSGVGAFHGFRVIFYGECISPPLDTMRRSIKAGGGVVLATAPPYTRHIADGLNFAVISPGIHIEDPFVQEFLKHDVACVLSDYLVDLVCRPSSPLEDHILYFTEKAAQQHRLDIAQFGIRRPSQHGQKAQQARKNEVEEDFCCSVCGKPDNEAVMLLCGDDKGKGCGAGVHIYCCTPALEKVPEEDWFCSKCQ